MKNGLLFLSFFLVLGFAAVAQDELYVIGNSNDPGSLGISQVTGVNPTTGTTANSPVTYATADATTQSAAMAIANGYIYYISQADEQTGGVFTVRSISANPATVNPSVAALTDDVNGAVTTNVAFRSMTAASDGSIYMTVSDGATMSLARFQTGAGGTASGFQMLGTITLDGVNPGSQFRNGDIAIDGSGNIYALINEDQVAGNAVIYFAPAAGISTTSGGNTNFVTKYQVVKADNSNFSEYVVGLAVASNGNFYLAVQDDVDASLGGVYLLTRNIAGDFVVSSVPISVNPRYAADIATAYFPTNTILPVVYGAISAKIVDNALVLNWSTLSETNNDHFEVEVSADGQNFTSLGTVDSKAIDGNSDTTINYSFSKSINTPIAAMGISLFSLAFVCLLANRKNRMLLSVMMIMGVGLTFASCSKGTDQIDVNAHNRLFVRIVQVDKDGKSSTSDAVSAYRTN